MKGGWTPHFSGSKLYAFILKFPSDDKLLLPSVLCANEVNSVVVKLVEFAGKLALRDLFCKRQRTEVLVEEKLCYYCVFFSEYCVGVSEWMVYSNLLCKLPRTVGKGSLIDEVELNRWDYM